MPELSLIVCIHGERELLARLLSDAKACFDDLVVVHDGPEERDQESVRALVEQSGGRFFVQPRANQQEPHWPFAWSEARYDWILRLDADEFPSVELKEWLIVFRRAPEPPESISGYSCIWPMWNGRQSVTRKYPAGRIFLFHRERVRFFGMVEQVPVADGGLETLPLVLEHRPNRKSYGLKNVLLRKQAYLWRTVIAESLLGKPTDLPAWRFQSDEWPEVWEQIRRHPLRTALFRLIVWPARALRDGWREEGKLMPLAAVSGGIHHCLIALKYWQLRSFRDHG